MQVLGYKNVLYWEGSNNIRKTNKKNTIQRPRIWSNTNFVSLFPECMQSECADTSQAWITTQRNIIKRKGRQVYLYTKYKCISIGLSN